MKSGIFLFSIFLFLSLYSCGTQKITEKYKITDISGYSEGRAAFQAYNRWGYLDQKWEIAVSPQFMEAGKFSEELAPVLLNKKWGYISTDGKFQINPHYERAEEFSEGLAAVEEDGLWGLYR